MKAKKLIFVIDDDPLILALVKKNLEGELTNIRTYQYGEECLNELNDNPDLIILDYLFHNKENSDVMGGKEIFEKILAHSKKIPVIMLSGQEDGDVVLELARMGIEDYVIKDQLFIANLKEVVNEVFNPED